FDEALRTDVEKQDVCYSRCNSGLNFGVNRKPRQTEPASVEPALRTTGMISTLQAPNFFMAAACVFISKPV
ncbi:MAG: hypothetical protein ACRD3O_19075, partial [Terriglobia bacterium]